MEMEDTGRALWENMPHFSSYFWNRSIFQTYWHILYPGKMTIKSAKKSPNLSFEPNLTNIFKYLVLKTVRQNSLIHPFLGLKNRKSREFCLTALDSRCMNSLFKLGSNDKLQKEPLDIGFIFA